MLTVTAVAILLVLGLSIARAVLGPTIFDRILAVNIIATKTVLLIAVLGFLYGQPEFLLDIALTYALINFISVIGVLRYFEFSETDRKAGPGK